MLFVVCGDETADCQQVMLDELSEAYNALRLGKAPSLPLVRLQYSDFAAWQCRRASSPAILRQVGKSPSHLPLPG